MAAQHLEKLEVCVLLEYSTQVNKIPLGLSSHYQKLKPKPNSGLTEATTLYLPKFDNDEHNLALSLANHIVNGYYHEIINSEIVEDVFKFSGNTSNDVNDEPGKSFSSFLQTCDNHDRKYARECILMFIGVTALQMFVKSNWTGPIQVYSTGKAMNDWAATKLASNKLPVYNLAHNVELLLVAKTLLCDLISLPLTSSWWKFRCIKVYQSVLMEECAQSHEEAKKCLPDMFKAISVCDARLQKEADIQLNLEAFHVFLAFGNLAKAKEHLAAAQKTAGIDVNLMGSLGKRTRFQQVPYAQLVLRVHREVNENTTPNHVTNTQDFPRDVSLQDDTLLNRVAYLDVNDQDVNCLYPLEQAIVLSLCHQIQKTSASDELLQEEAMAYVERILQQPQSWCIQMSSLFMRCKLEKHKTRKVERSMNQMQALVDSSKSESPSCTRLQLFYCNNTPSWWVLEKELAHLLISLGAIKSALDIFLHLKLWEEVVMCYKSLQEPERAAKVLREQLSLKETPMLWCLLGDVTENPECYEKAWSLSAGRSSRAQKSLGLFHYRKKNYSESIVYLLKSTELNSLDLTVWFPLAFSALQIGDYNLAARSYRHIVNLDPESFEAWNNLSKVYVLTKQKERAWKTLQEALKCNYEEWKIWENYLVVSVDVGAFEDALKAWHRLIELKGKHADNEILGIIVKAILDDVRDIHNQPASRLTTKALELLGHITSTETNNAKVWSLYGSLLNIKQGESLPDIMDRVILYQQKAFHCATQKKDWEKDPKICREAFGYAEKLIDSGMNFFSLHLDEEKATRSLQSIRLTVKNGIKLVLHYLETFPQDDLRELCEGINAKLVQMMNFMES